MNSPILITLAIIFSCLDLLLTYFYLQIYREWQPKKPFNLIEKNILLVYLMNKLGLKWGMFLGSLIILILIAFIVSFSPWWLVAIVFIFIVVALGNHYKNFELLRKIMEKYPNGHLPEKTFGKVEGSNELNNQGVNKNE